MPAFVGFGRKWKLGSDDFIFPATIDTIVKVSWLIATIIIFILNEAKFQSCQDELWTKFYFYGLIISVSMSILIDIAVIKNSMKGSIMDVESRRLVEIFVYLRLGWEVADIGLNITGTIWILDDKFMCLEIISPATYNFIRRFVICNWISIAVIVLLLIYFYDSNGLLNNTTKLQISQCVNKYDVPIVPNSMVWINRFKRYCCFFKSSAQTDEELKIQDGFYEVGSILAFLLHQSEFVPSDVIAGLIALYTKENGNRLSELKAQSQRMQLNENVLDKIITKQPIPPAPIIQNNDSHVIEKKKIIIPNPETQVYLLRHFFNFIHGVSGWKGFLLNKHKNACFRLWKSSICCGCVRKPYKFDIIGDNCCFSNMSALKQTMPELNEEDLLYVSFNCNYYEVPFFVAIDHCTKSIVVTLRGSYSMEDFITDFSGIPTQFNIEGQPIEETYLAHHGMLLTAQNIKRKLDLLNVLPNAKQKFPEYKLVFVGQSLGGGSAVILGMMFHAQYNDLKVYCFNAPGGLLSLNAAEWCESFVTSIIYGDDMLARFSINSVDELKYKVIQAINDCSTPKYKILCKGFSSCLCGNANNRSIIEDQKQTTKDTKIQVDNLHSNNKGSNSKSTNHQEIARYTHLMYLPGKIIHITENPRFQINNNSNKKKNENKVEEDNNDNNSSTSWYQDYFRFHIKWANRNEFLSIKISPRMNLDHSHFRMLKAFDEYL